MYIKETEKAVCMGLVVNYYSHTMEDYVERKFEVWVPKSQLSKEGIPGNWITSQKVIDCVSQQIRQGSYEAFWETISGERFEPQPTASELQKESEYEKKKAKGLEKHNQLVLAARSAGLKVTAKMKTSTIYKKFQEANVEIPDFKE